MRLPVDNFSISLFALDARSSIFFPYNFEHNTEETGNNQTSSTEHDVTPLEAKNAKEMLIPKYSQDAQAEIMTEIRNAVGGMAGTHIGNSPEEVAVWLDSKLKGIGDKYKIEIGSIIQQLGENSFTFVDAVTQFIEGRVDLKLLSNGSSIYFNHAKGHIATWHNHPSDSISFSSDDISVANTRRATSFVSLQIGIMKYNYNAYYNEVLSMRQTMHDNNIKPRHIDTRIGQFVENVKSNSGSPYTSMISKR